MNTVKIDLCGLPDELLLLCEKNEKSLHEE